MFAWVTAFLAGLKIFNAALPAAEVITEKIIGGIGLFVANIAGDLWGTSAESTIQSYVNEAEGIVIAIDNDVTAVDAWLATEVPSLEALFNLLPNLGAEVYARYVVMAARHGINANSTPEERAAAHKMAAKMVPIAHANVRTKQAAAAAKP